MGLETNAKLYPDSVATKTRKPDVRICCGNARCYGGGCEIRTHEGFPLAGFQDRCNRPLCQTPKISRSTA